MTNNSIMTYIIFDYKGAFALLNTYLIHPMINTRSEKGGTVSSQNARICQVKVFFQHCSGLKININSECVYIRFIMNGSNQNYVHD